MLATHNSKYSLYIVIYCSVADFYFFLMQWHNCKLTSTDTDILLRNFRFTTCALHVCNVHHITCYVKTFDAVWKVLLWCCLDIFACFAYFATYVSLYNNIQLFSFRAASVCLINSVASCWSWSLKKIGIGLKKKSLGLEKCPGLEKVSFTSLISFSWQANMTGLDVLGCTNYQHQSHW